MITDMGVDWEPAVRDPLRLAAVARSGLVGIGPEDAFDRYIELATELTGAPRGCIALVDAVTTTAFSSAGFPEGAALYAPIEHSFCRFVVGAGRPFVVHDARNDDRTRGDPAIDLFGAAAWAGYFIQDGEGTVLGTFCVMDADPHEWSPHDLHLLAALAKAVSTEIALRSARSELAAVRLEIERLRTPD